MKPMLDKTEKALAIGLETVGSCTVLTGVVIEIVCHADLGYILMTVGAFAVSVGGLIWAKVIRR